MADEAKPTRWVVRDDEGRWVETHACETREQAIHLFSYPSLRWEAYEADGWTIERELLTKPLGEPSPANVFCLSESRP